MFSLRKPSRAAADHLLREQSFLELTYREVGVTAAWGASSWAPPSGYHHDQASAVLGRGERTFRAAMNAFRRWRQFDVGWADIAHDGTPIETGQVVAVRARILGLWTMHACRIVYTIDDDGPVARFGFGYGTLPGHMETGEERFLVAWDRSSDLVTYDIAAFVRPRHLLAKLGTPHATRLADRFRRESAAAMARAVIDV